MTKSFKAQIEDFRNKTVRDTLYVATASIQDVMEGAMTPQLGVTKGAGSFEEGKIPVAEADLINSLTTNGILGKDSYVTVISSMKLGDTIRFAWTAEHALPMEVGTPTIEGRHYVGKNAAKFPDFVEQRSREVR